VIRVDDELIKLLTELYEFGVENDSKTDNHVRRMLNVTPDTGLFLSIMVRAIGAENVLEIGTSNGYSTMWIADALRDRNGKVVTLEMSTEKADMAKRNFARSGLLSYIDFHQADAHSFLSGRAPKQFDMVFMDAERKEYVSYWGDVDRALRVGGVLVVDNANSPKPEELISFFDLVRKTNRYLSQILQVGKGEFLAVKLENQ